MDNLEEFKAEEFEVYENDSFGIHEQKLKRKSNGFTSFQIEK